MSESDNTEKLSIVIEDDGSAPANSCSDALERLQRVFNDFDGAGAEKYFANFKGGAEGAAKEFKRLGEIGKTAGSALASAMSGTQKWTLAAVASTTKLSSALDLATNRAKALKAAEDRAFGESMIRSNRTPTALQSSPGAVSGFRQVVGAVGQLFGQEAAGKFVRASAYLSDTVERLGPIGPALASGATALVGVGAALVVGATVAAIKFGSVVVQAQAYREDVEGALELITKSEAGAKAVLGRISATADDLGISREASAAKFISLMNKELSEGKAEEVIKRLADLGEVNPAAPLDALSEAIGTISSKGVFASKSLNALADAGVTTNEVYAALGKQLGKTRPELEKLMGAGKISGAQGVDAVLEAIKQKTGGGAAGALAGAESMDDMAALITRLENIPKDILFDIDGGPGMDATKAFMRDVIEFFSSSSETGKETRQVVGDVFNALAEGFFGVSFSKGGTKDALKELLDNVKKNIPEIKAFASSIRTIADALVSVTTLLPALGKFVMPTADFSGAGTAIQLLITDIETTITSAATAVYNAAMALGSKIPSGIIAGIKGFAGGVGQAAVDMVAGIFPSMAGPKGIDAHSPSKKAEKVGSHVPTGFEVALNAGRLRLSNAGAALAAAAIPPANDNAAISPMVAPSPSPTANGTMPSISVVVQVTAGPNAGGQENADMIAREVERQVKKFYRGLVREAG